jgi:hypothetical protein
LSDSSIIWNYCLKVAFLYTFPAFWKYLTNSLRIRHFWRRPKFSCFVKLYFYTYKDVLRVIINWSKVVQDKFAIMWNLAVVSRFKSLFVEITTYSFRWSVCDSFWRHTTCPVETYCYQSVPLCVFINVRFSNTNVVLWQSDAKVQRRPPLRPTSCNRRGKLRFICKMKTKETLYGYMKNINHVHFMQLIWGSQFYETDTFQLEKAHKEERL